MSKLGKKGVILNIVLVLVIAVVVGEWGSARTCDSCVCMYVSWVCAELLGCPVCYKNGEKERGKCSVNKSRWVFGELQVVKVQREGGWALLPTRGRLVGFRDCFSRVSRWLYTTIVKKM